MKKRKPRKPKKRKPKKRKARKGKKPAKCGKRKRAKKSTAAQALMRQNIVFKLLLAGEPRREIIRYSKNKWGISHDQVDKYIKKATDVWEGIAGKSHQAELSMEIERANGLYRVVLKKRNYLTALSTLKHICTLKRLNNIQLDIKGAITLEARLGGMADEEINKMGSSISHRLAQHGVNITRARKAKASKGRRG